MGVRAAASLVLSWANGPNGGGDAMEPTFFRNGAEFRTWLERHDDRDSELLIGYYKKDSR